MYKIYFNNRIVYLTDNYTTNFNKFDGLFYKYNDKKEFEKFWEFFEVVSSSVNNLFIISDDIEKLKHNFYSFFEVVDAAGGVVTNDKGQVLIIKRFGKWDLPKGKVKDNEEIPDTALREISEECGITSLKIIKQLQPTYHTYYLNNQQILKQTYWFQIEYIGNETFRPQLEEDITEVKWFDSKDLPLILDNTYNSIIDVLIDSGKLELQKTV
ncbi:MAG: NUDIX domain-containing protein [Bacteroidales bacterium]|nr:NUDIX domain-containing protein [Bacteroidales bacterium]